MLLPDKHIKVAESILGLGSALLGLLDRSKEVDELWSQFSSINDSELYPAHQSFDNFILALDFLYLVGAIEIREGEITKCA